MVRGFLPSLGLTILVTFPAMGAGVSLEDAYQAALKSTEVTPQADARVNQSEARVDQVTGRLLPNINFLASYLRQDTTTNVVGATSAFVRPDQWAARFNLVQPLFRGFGEWAEWRGQRALVRAQEAERDHAKLVLYASVAESYFRVLSAERDALNLELQAALTLKRVEELAGRVRIGRSRKGELLAAESQTATLKAELEGAAQAVAEAREALRFMTGLPADTSLPSEELPVPAEIPTLDACLGKLTARPDITARENQRTASDETVTVARASHFPALDLTANYYLKRTGILADSRWDVGVQLTIPLFQGGTISATVQEALERRRESELGLARLKRDAEREIRTLHYNLRSGIAQLKALEQAVKTAEENYKEQTRDYRYGLVTNLDVLQSLDTFHEVKRAHDRTRFEALIAVARLTSAVGGKLP